MAFIEGIRIQNFRSLKDVSMGKFFSHQSSPPLTPFTVVIGKNGVGKTSLFDAFGFIADCLNYDVEHACEGDEDNKRGGFDRIRTKGTHEPIKFEIYYRENSESRPISYELAIDKDRSGRAFVFSEILRQRRFGQRHGQPFPFLKVSKGAGFAWKGEKLTAHAENVDLSNEESNDLIDVKLSSTRELGIASYGQLKEHPRIEKFRNFLKGWYLSYFNPDAARSLPTAGVQRRLNKHGENIVNVVQYLERDHPDKFANILAKIAEKIPGIEKIDSKKTEDDRLLLQFNERGYADPFFQMQMSDGTLKLFNYLILLEDPDPPPFICIEEPENGLYHKLLEIMAREFRDHAAKSRKGSQIFVTTHQPYFVDALDPEEVWILEKGEDGYSKITRASEIELVKNLVAEGFPLGGLWYADYLDAR
ncbi:MAG: AAA family ATPase [Candidatus Symbiobacter sp.]|nr:AAA family ATPase [Candidatus Symbiobacter sp.]